MKPQHTGEIAAGAFVRAELSTRSEHSGKKRRILIIHQNFPGQFRHIAQHLLTRTDVEVIGLGRDSAPGLADFPWFKYKLHRGNNPQTHPYLLQMEAAVLHGQAVARALTQLKRKGFTPDIILAHPGWGETLYAKEVFPQARLIHFCEWYYSTSGADFNFDPEFPPTLDDRLRIDTWNGLHLLNLQNCDVAVSPTAWQKSRHPKEYQDKIQVIHEGIDTANLEPDPSATLTLRHSREGGNPGLSAVERTDSSKVDASILDSRLRGNDGTLLTLRAGDPVVTYVARNLEPYRGFHTFMRALPALLKAHPTCNVVIVGGDGRSYGQAPKGAPNWREKMLSELRASHDAQIDDYLERVHFLGRVPYETYKKVLQISAAHVYLTYPFVLSWSMLEAMASGCLVIGADVPPVREVVTDGRNGMFANFFDAAALADTIRNVLDSTTAELAPIKVAAQAHVRANYGFHNGLRAYLNLLGLPDKSPFADTVAVTTETRQSAAAEQ